MVQKGMSKEMLENMSKLTEREREYFMSMWPKSGVLYITSKPGIAKSAIARSIAKKMNFSYMDIRLSMVDETDVGLYPNISSVEIDNPDIIDNPELANDSNTPKKISIKCLDFVVPKWAVKANQRPTIIHFEELNRASLPVRNAALQILLERQIGTEFRFNEFVLMIASGNLGDEDGTDVEEFDAALNNRLIHHPHTLSADEWIDGYAKENVHPIIVSYIKNYPERLYQEAGENNKAYATPRSWTFLSDFIVNNFSKINENGEVESGMKASPKDFLSTLTKVGHTYIGNSAVKFYTYCQDMINISINDVLNRYDDIQADLAKYNRDKNSELIHSLKELDIKKMSDKQIDNVTKFLKGVGEDELTAYLLYILDNVPDVADPKIKKFMQSFKDVLISIKRINKPGGGK